MRDMLPFLLPTLGTCIGHHYAVLPSESSGTKANYASTTVIATMIGYAAGYHAECTRRRRWMWYPYSGETDTDLVAENRFLQRFKTPSALGRLAQVKRVKVNPQYSIRITVAHVLIQYSAVTTTVAVTFCLLLVRNVRTNKYS